MSGLERAFNGRLWTGVLLCVAMSLTVAALGAVATVCGITSCENAWIWIGVCWGSAGLLGGRYAARGERYVLLRSVICVSAAMLALWLTGMTATEVPLSRHWLWYVGAGLLGAILGATVPWHQKKRRRKGHGRYAAKR